MIFPLQSKYIDLTRIIHEITDGFKITIKGNKMFTKLPLKYLSFERN